MGSIPGQFPISLRAWPTKDDNAVPISSLIERINNERGSFREVTEDALIEELYRDKTGSTITEDDDHSVVEDVEEEPDRLKELLKARGEILGQLEQAQTAAVITLDFVSLLLSKDTPVQASLSISPSLRDVVALGTLGADKVQDSRVTQTQRHERRRVAKGWKLQSLTDSVDSILASASRLENEIEKETQYWEQILAINRNGWAICRLPQEKHTLGVRYGFAESAPAFYSRSLGALRRNTDGTIFLDQGNADSTSKQVRIRIKTNGITTGTSSSFEPIQNPSSIESSILAARNTIFEGELWQELNREARILANQGVRIIGDEIVFKMRTNKKIVLDLQIAEEIQSDAGGSGNDDTIAEMISLALHLLLSYAHRQNHHRRTRPPPPITSRPPPRPPYSLLRPIVMRLNHEAVMSSLKTLLIPLSKALISTGVCESVYTKTTASIASTIESRVKSAKYPIPLPEQTIDALISHLSAEVAIPLTMPPFPAQSLTIQLLTLLSTLETRFRISVTGLLMQTCKPPLNPSTVEEVKDYILWATSCAVAGTFTDVNDFADGDKMATEADSVNTRQGDKWAEAEELTSGLHGWQLTHDPTVLRKTFKNEKDSKELAFEVISIPEEENVVRIKASYKYVSGQQAEGRENGAITQTWSSGTSKDTASEMQNGDKEKDIKLKDFIETIGKWSETPTDTTKTLGDG